MHFLDAKKLVGAAMTPYLKLELAIITLINSPIPSTV